MCLIAFDLKFVRVAWSDANQTMQPVLIPHTLYGQPKTLALHHIIHPSVVKEQIGPAGPIR